MLEEKVFSFFEGLEEHDLELIENLDTEEDISIVGGLEALIQGLNYNSNSVILPICEHFGRYLTIDQSWVNKLKAYNYRFITRKTSFVDHMEFFGSPYVGLQRITFTTADRNEWFSDIFDVDEEELKENLLNVKAIDKTWNVVGDVFNTTIPYLLYRIYHSGLNSKLKEEAMVEVLCMYHYKCLSSIINNDYPFTARREVALETYNRLSLKYDIKRYGSWHKLIRARAEFIIDSRKGIHFKTFTKMNDDKKIVYMVGDIQNRLRRIVTEINQVFHEVKNKTDIVSFSSAQVALGDEIALRHVTKEVTDSVNYIDRIIVEGTSFFKEELIEHIGSVVEGLPKDKLAYIIQEYSTGYNNPRKKYYKEFVETVVLHAYEYLHLHNVRKTNVYDVLLKIRGALGAPLSRNDSVRIIREVGDKIVKEETGIKTRFTVQLIRTGLALYIVLRVFSRSYYD